MTVTDSYVFKLGENGTELNTGVATPFVDIQRVYGFDSAPIRETERDHEGVDGGFLDAEYERGRPIMMDGIVYADATTLEDFLDVLKAEWAPRTAPMPLYFRAPGQADRVMFIKPRGVRYDWEANRRLGISRIQFVGYAEDPRIYTADLQSVVIELGGPVSNGIGFAGLFDTFTRNVSNGWGTADSGHTYSLTGTAADFDCNGSLGRITLNAAVNSRYYAAPNVILTHNHYVYVQAHDWNGGVPVGGNISGTIDMDVIDDSNYYRVIVVRTASNTMTVAVQRAVAGVVTTLTGFQTVAGVNATSSVSVRAESIRGPGGTFTTIRAKVWANGTAEPDAWNVEAIDNSHTLTGGVRFGAARDTGNIDTGSILSWGTIHVAQGVEFNLNFGGGAVPSGGVAFNGGNRPSPAILTIQGPITNPQVVNDTNQGTLNFEIALGNTDFLVVDLDHKTVLLNGVTNRRAALIAPGWFLLSPGSNFIRFGGSSGGVPTLTIQYRHAWR